MADPPRQVFYHYQIYQQPIFDEMRNTLESQGINIKFIQGVPGDEQIEDLVQSKIKPALIILDDLVQSLSRGITNLFQVGSRHARISISKNFYLFLFNI